ncbi:MAG: ABC transporter permease [Betaproteobacteria bacterium]|nr:ABC transporter permease [Betaproteobacteria bacterium]
MTAQVAIPRRGLGLVGAVLFLVAWELAARLLWRDAQALPAPSQALGAARHLTRSSWSITSPSVSVASAVASRWCPRRNRSGRDRGWYPWLGRLARPLVDLLRPIPPLAWIPIAIVWFGLGEPSKWFVIFLGAFFPVFNNAYRGMTSIPPVLLRAARTMDVDGPALLFRVALPAALPDISVGLRVGFGLSFGTLVAAELIAADSGMGYLVMQSRQIGELGLAVFGILLIGIVSLLADLALDTGLRRLLGRGIRH